MGGVIQARSVSDGIGTTFDAAPSMAADPPAYAGGLYGERKRWDSGPTFPYKPGA